MDIWYDSDSDGTQPCMLSVCYDTVYNYSNVEGHVKQCCLISTKSRRAFHSSGTACSAIKDTGLSRESRQGVHLKERSHSEVCAQKCSPERAVGMHT